MGCTMKPVSGAGEPEHGDIRITGPEIFVDGAHIGHLEAPAELDAEEAEAHVPDLPEGKRGFLHGVLDGRILRVAGRGSKPHNRAVGE